MTLFCFGVFYHRVVKKYYSFSIHVTLPPLSQLPTKHNTSGNETSILGLHKAILEAAEFSILCCMIFPTFLAISYF